MKKTFLAGKRLVFQSKMENWAEGMDYCAIPVPAKITQALGTKAAVLVMARVNPRVEALFFILILTRRKIQPMVTLLLQVRLSFQ